MKEVKIDDIDELKEKNKKLEEELNYLRQYKEALDRTTIISKTDLEGNITDVNKMFEKISGYTKDELMGKPHNIVRHPKMPKLIFKKMWDTIKRGKIFKGVIRNKKKDGGDYYVVANIIPIKNEDGEITEYIAIRQDVTKRMQLQKEQEQFLNNLISYFLDKIKLPNFVINKYSNLIEDELKKDTPSLELIKKYNSYIKKEALMLQKRYNNMKLFLQFKQHKIKSVIEPIQIAKVFQYLFKKHNKKFDKKIIFKIPDKSIIINTDKVLFITMLENLFTNSLLYAKSEVCMSLLKKNGVPVITIEHDGDIQENQIESFNFLTQLKKDNSNTEELGIGMYIAKKISDLFKYNITFKNENGNNCIEIKLNVLPPKKLL